MAPLPRELRKLLENVIIAARDAAEDAARAALRALSVDREEAHPGISDEDRALRVALRARARQLGEFELLVAEVAYEQWHRMLFARFLAENDLLMHPSGVSVTLPECADLAPGEGEPDEWMLAARYASQMLPGIFRLDDPSVRVRFARDDIATLERLLTSVPPAAFSADDSLGWVYQFWQSKKKKEVNASERKIGGADIPPVTQLFTEHYMVAFLLQNSLGSWWSGRHPESPLVAGWEYLRFGDDGRPVSGAYPDWPNTAAEITVMDPCCGSGHFLVAAFEMLCQMRQEEEALTAREAGDAVLRDNLHGLELDGRCVQIAVFAVAMSAWKSGGYRELPPMNIACSGVPAHGRMEEWRRLAPADPSLAEALERLRSMFGEADTLGSLIDPRRAAAEDTLLGVDYDRVAPLLHNALARYAADDPAQAVLSLAAEDVATAAQLLAKRYSLVATNPPYLGSGLQSDVLRDWLAKVYPSAKADLATAFQLRCEELAVKGGAVATVSPQAWLYLPSFGSLREKVLRSSELRVIAKLGSGAFETISGAVVNVALLLLSRGAATTEHEFFALDATQSEGSAAKAAALREQGWMVHQAGQLQNPDSALTLREPSRVPVMGASADCWQGLVTADDNRFVLRFWELGRLSDDWERLQLAPQATSEFTGRHAIVRWQKGRGDLHLRSGAHNFPSPKMLGRPGVVVQRMSNLNATLYSGDIFGDSAAPIVPRDPDDVTALWCYVRSPEFAAAVRLLNQKTNVTPGTFLKISFDRPHWKRIAAEQFPAGLPQPSSSDPTQWLFNGTIVGSDRPLHVALARLIGYSWPEQVDDGLGRFCDSDGVVCVPAVGGERPLADRLRELLANAYGSGWSESLLSQLLASEGGSDLERWLRDTAFVSHAKLFHNRPFCWHVWDGTKDGFSAMLNYHLLDRQTLERFTYSTLQWWIDRQKIEAGKKVPGADTRLADAMSLQRRLTAIIDGEPPHDIFVRWKSLAEQPIGWSPDLEDGVRANIRPFVEAGVLRSKFTIAWKADKGKNPDGSLRANDLHFANADKLAARGEN